MIEDGLNMREVNKKESNIKKKKEEVKYNSIYRFLLNIPENY